MNNFFKDLVKSASGISMTKVWGTVVSASGTVVALALAGVVEVPKNVLGVLIFIGAASGKMTIDAARNAIDKLKK